MSADNNTLSKKNLFSEIFRILSNTGSQMSSSCPTCAHGAMPTLQASQGNFNFKMSTVFAVLSNVYSTVAGQLVLT